MVCHACGAENRADRRFCRSCGGSLVAGCPACGATNEPEDRFCGSCGTSLAQGGSVVAAPVAPARLPGDATVTAAPTAERRLVTVVFADLVGFTMLADGRDPEETRELLGRWFDLARDVIERYGGAVEKFIGDAVMAVWGAPVAREDDVERAVRAALELVESVGRLGSGIQARAGVLTGEAAVTIGAVGQGMVAGDLVNTASRLQSVAAPGTVLVGEATQRATSAAVVFESVGDQQFKGKAMPVPVWRAIRVVAEVGGRNRSEGLEAPFVGREEELRLLKDLFHATGRERRTRLVSIVGPAGIGKSRLAWEFSKYADGVLETVWWHQGRSPAYGDGISFWALGEMVRRRCGLAEGDDDTTTRTRIRETVGRFVTDDDERRWIEVGLRALLGVGDGPPGGPQELFSAWRTFFERIAGQGTTALVFEDLHWADPGTLDFIDHLLDWTRGLPIFIVTLARPDLLERRPDWGAGRRSFTSVFLEPLSDPDMRALLEGLAPGLPASAVSAVVARADGIPLYAVETVRMLVSQGRLAERDGVYEPVGEIGSLEVPETLTALIAARLDGVGAMDRGLLQDAAVLGQSFSLAALEAVSGVSRAELEPRIAALVRREILVRLADPRSPERGQLAFVQSLIREVAYNTLARPDRRTRHLAAARYFESMGGEELAGALAAQYLAAYRASPEGPERGSLAVQARVSLKAAADRAAQLGSPDQAVSYLRQALEVTTEPNEQAAILEQAGTLAAIANRLEARDLLRRALELRRAGGDRHAIARATELLGRGLMDLRDLEGALPVLEKGCAEFQDLEPDPVVIGLTGQLARVLMLLARDEEALVWCERTLVAAERADLAPLVADAFITRGSALASLRRYREAVAVLRAGISLAEEIGHGATALRGISNLAGIQGELAPVAAMEASRAGIAMARRQGHGSLEASMIANLGSAALQTGEWDEAVMLLEERRQEEASAHRLGLACQILSTYLLFRGAGYEEVAAETRALLDAEQDVVARSGLLDMAALEAFAEGRWADTRTAALASNAMATYPGIVLLAIRASLLAKDAAAAAACLEAFDALGAHGPAFAAQRLGMVAGIAALRGETGTSAQGYQDALAALAAQGLRFAWALTATEMITLSPGEPAAREAAREARGILAQLGASVLLRRLEATMEEASERTTTAG